MGPFTDALPERPATDADRDLAVAALREAAGRSFLSLDEVERRLPSVFRAKTVGELAALTWDLLPSVPSSAPQHRESIFLRSGFGVHFVVYSMVCLFLIGIWAMTGHGFFWPFFPIAGWGIGVAAHGAAAASAKPGDRDHDHHHERPHGPPRQPVHGRQPRPLAAQAPEPPKQAPTGRAVVMFVDIVNSTRLNEAIGDAAWHALRTRHVDMVRECLLGHDGSVVSLQGDGIFARFDNAREAVGCAVEIQKRIEARREDTGFAPSVRIGLHGGDAIEFEGDLLGTMVNVAARVTSEATADEILLTEPVADWADGSFQYDDRGLRTLKGISRPRHLLAVLW